MGLRVNAARALRGGEQLRHCRRLVRTPPLSRCPRRESSTRISAKDSGRHRRSPWKRWIGTKLVLRVVLHRSRQI
jgi:hypothetical protein